MNKLYIGIDAGSYLIKGVIIDKYNNVIGCHSVRTLLTPIESTKSLMNILYSKIDTQLYEIVSIGVTGTYRKLISKLLDATIIKNEINASIKAISLIYPDTKTIIDLGYNTSSLIQLNNGSLIHYELNNLCSSGSGSFLSNMQEKFHISNEELCNMDYLDNNTVSNKCIIFAETDIYNKIRLGFPKEKIISSIYNNIVSTYKNNIIKDNKIESPILFIGGLSKNKVLVELFKNYIKKDIFIPKNSDFICAYGISLLAKDSNIEKHYIIKNINLETKYNICTKCSNKCEIISLYRDNELIDYWGNRCNKISF